MTRRAGRRALARVAASERLLVALDFDGTLAPLVDEPMDARALPDRRAPPSSASPRCRHPRRVRLGPRLESLARDRRARRRRAILLAGRTAWSSELDPARRHHRPARLDEMRQAARRAARRIVDEVAASRRRRLDRARSPPGSACTRGGSARPPARPAARRRATRSRPSCRHWRRAHRHNISSSRSHEGKDDVARPAPRSTSEPPRALRRRRRHRRGRARAPRRRRPRRAGRPGQVDRDRTACAVPRTSPSCSSASPMRVTRRARAPLRGT